MEQRCAWWVAERCMWSRGVHGVWLRGTCGAEVGMVGGIWYTD